MSDSYGWIDEALNAIHRANWYRSPKLITGRADAVVQLDGRSVVNFASNDYLGLAGDERLIQAAIAATKEYGTGSTGSRLITGHRPLHRDLERAIAQLKQTEDAIVFSSGYLANLGAIAALVGKRDLILSDQYNHSSLRNGSILSGATLRDYAHCNVANVREILQQQRDRHRRCLILTDSIFSMDGDLCPLPQLLDLADEFDSMLLVDEAHATGVLGDTGSGSVEHFGCTGRPIIQMGTLSKALGSLGGYVAGSASLIDFLRNRAASWIYTTGLSPADTAAALAAIRVITQDGDSLSDRFTNRRAALWQNVNWLKQNLITAFNSDNSTTPHTLLPSHSPILCLQVDRPSTALQIGNNLLQQGLFVPAIRPPTVPTSRLRITVMATHQPAQLEQLVESLHSIFS
ncbi:8-amino-7-oxononanoate synthase [Phormidium sp. CLA17]|uniref:8-amino-7-oxononanoate synthase n=1 Tax=Leptolyngbya sp. Cla-17 TaxID=2803751 RepID=UPI0014918BAD|nr:8-amino-7-oxononanoate synthase [Leptolyngbya sp. Cla-17]MBM0740822.1 8-amino-7-oxononanoate synthase [Leptolyngbya sp. Cla-17]